MPSAVAIVAHHDDHILWMGGTIQRLRATGWNWSLIAMCVPDDARRPYYCQCCEALGVNGCSMDFRDYQGPNAFAINRQADMEAALEIAVRNKEFDLVFTHSRLHTGEYWAEHANHVEVRTVVTSLVRQHKLGKGAPSLALFAYDLVYGGAGRATVVKKDPPHAAQYHLQLTYPELILKAQWCMQAPMR